MGVNGKGKTRRQGAKSGLGLWFALGVWIVLVSIPLSYFSAAHLTSLPIAKQPLSSSLDGRWRIMHVLGESCACSRSVLDYLQRRGALSDVAEETLLLEARPGSLEGLRQAGFLANGGDAEALCAGYGAEGVPFFQILRPDGEVAYSGSYFDGMARPTSGFLDVDTLRTLRSGGWVPERPVYGCPTSDRLRTRLDPFGLKQL
ncbi:hypothetical protein QEH54_13810 [Pelagicoccus sp. SDUM812003]|nr:hypothetical protein [Pelagicoccus sp. SDUM812003]